MKGDRRRLFRIFFWDFLDHEDTKASWLSFILQTFINNGDQVAHILFLLLKPDDDYLPMTFWSESREPGGKDCKRIH